MKFIYLVRLNLAVSLFSAVLSGCAPVEFHSPNRGKNNPSGIPADPGDNGTSGTAPVVTITTPTPNQQIATPTVTVGGTCSGTQPVSISGSGVATQVNTPCNSGNFSTPVTLTPGDGVKTITASQTNPSGTGSATVTINRGTTQQLPVVTIDSPAANSVIGNTVSISGRCEDSLPVQHAGTGNASPGTANCNNGQYQVTITPTAGDGTKNITVTQTNGAGTGSDNRNFVRQSQNSNLPPVVAFTSPEPMTRAVGGLQVQGTCESGLTVVLSGSGHASPASTPCDQGKFSVNIVFSAGTGTKEIKATQTNAYGIGEATRSFIADNNGQNQNPPVVKITSPAANSVVMRTFTVSGSCEAGITVLLSGTGLASSMNTACADKKFSASVMVAGNAGDKQVVATQENAYGTGRDERTFKFNGDGGSQPPLPTVKITSPAANSTVSEGFELSGTCTNGLVVKISGTGSRLDSNVECKNGTFRAPVLVTPEFGTKIITASQTNDAGTAIDSRPFNYGTSGALPVIQITGPAANSSHETGVNLVGTCENGLPIQVSGQGSASEFFATCVNGVFQMPVPFSTGDGSKTIIVSQTRPGVGTGSSTRNFIRTSPVLAPVVAIKSPAANTSAEQGLTVSGTCTPNLPVSIAGSGVQTKLSVSCNQGQFTAAISFTAGEGVKQVTASQTNSAGTATDSRNFVRTEDCEDGDLLLKDDFERTNVIDSSPEGLSWTTVLFDYGGRIDNIEARIMPGSVMVNAPSGSRSLYMRGRMGASQHAIWLISKSIDVSKYSKMEIAFQYLPIDFESIEKFRVEICHYPAPQCDPKNNSHWTTLWEHKHEAPTGPLTNNNRTSFRWKSAKVPLDLKNVSPYLKKELRFRFNAFMDDGIETPINTWPNAGQNYKMIDGVGLDLVTVRATNR